MNLQKKTPEINELEPVFKSLKIWAHNFEKQQSSIILKIEFFLAQKKLDLKNGMIFPFKAGDV